MPSQALHSCRIVMPPDCLVREPAPSQSGQAARSPGSCRPLRDSFTRQLFLGESLDSDRIEASYDNGVLTVTIPVAESARPRKVGISAGNGKAKAITTESKVA